MSLDIFKKNTLKQKNIETNLLTRPVKQFEKVNEIISNFHAHDVPSHRSNHQLLLRSSDLTCDA